VFGSNILINPPPMRRVATMRMGIAQYVSTRYPNTRFPKIAPILAETNVIAIAVPRKLVGNNSIPRQSSALNPIVETAPNTQLRIRFIVELFTK